MVIVTALNNVRCSLRPELIVAVAPGPPTTVVLTSGLSLGVQESPDEVQRRLERARRPQATAAARTSHARTR